MDTPETLREYRSVPFVDMEAANDGGQFVGYAAVFDREADLGSFTESVNRGAFRKALAAGDNVPMLLDHQEQLQPFAVTRNGSLKLSEDTKGLRVEATLTQSHPHFEYLRDGVQSGMIDGMSWGFIAGPGNSRLEQRGTKPHRALINFKRLLDVSPTWDKTYADTEAAFRSLRMLEELATDLDETDETRSPKTYTAAERKAATTMPDGAFPIDNVADLKRAIQSVGRAKDPVAARAWIKKRAKALGATDLIPQEWRSGATDLDQEQQEDLEGEHEQREDTGASDHEPDNDTQTDEERRSESVDEPSGVAIRAAARRRRLQMMDITLPQEFRA